MVIHLFTELPLRTSEEHKSRVLSVALDERTSPEEPVIKEVTDRAIGNNGLEMLQSVGQNKTKETGSQPTTINAVSVTEVAY